MSVAAPVRPFAAAVGRRWRTLSATPVLVVFAMVVLTLWLVVVIFGPLLAPYGPSQQSSAVLSNPSVTHIFGTDELGRDELSRVISGARISIPFSFVIVAIALVIGSILGGLAGYLGGWVDGLIMRITDLFFAFPAIVLAMAIAAILGPSLTSSVVAVVVVAWPNYARVIRSLVLPAMHSDYVVTARLLGSSSVRALVRDVMPNVIGPMVVYSALGLGDAMLVLAGLSFLGLGSQPPTAEWGSMISDGAQYFEQWWLALFPGLAIVSVVLSLNVLGDRVRDTLDPRVNR